MTDLDTLARAGWDNAELIWEQIQEAACSCVAESNHQEAGELWQGALDVAREHLAANDLRLATSLANCALALNWRRQQTESLGLLDQALLICHASDAWVETLRPPRRARSALYHLRLERRYPGAYESLARQNYTELAAVHRQRIEQLKSGFSNIYIRAPQWRKQKPAGFDDARKLLAAVYLLI